MSLYEEFVVDEQKKPSMGDFKRIFHPMTSVEPENFARHNKKLCLEDIERRLR